VNTLEGLTHSLDELGIVLDQVRRDVFLDRDIKSLLEVRALHAGPSFP
jgi:hypothetical protein